MIVKKSTSVNILSVSTQLYIHTLSNCSPGGFLPLILVLNFFIHPTLLFKRKKKKKSWPIVLDQNRLEAMNYG